MTLSKSLRGRLVLALATLFALIMFAGCDDDEVAQPNADTNAANGAIEVMGDELTRASGGGPITPVAVGSAGLGARVMALIAQPAMVSALHSQPNVITPLPASHTCLGGGTISFTGSVNYDFTSTSTSVSFSLVGSGITATFSGCRSGSGQYLIDGVVNISVNEAITMTQVSTNVFDWVLTLNDTLSGDVTVQNLFAGTTHPITFNHSLVGTIDFTFDGNTNQATENLVDVTLTVTVNSQTCTGRLTSIVNDTFSWACSG